MAEATTRWRVGAVAVTAVVEHQTDRIPPEFFFPEGSAPEVAHEDWLFPAYAAADGTIALRVQAFLVEVAGRVVLVDPCVGNRKQRAMPFWHQQQFPWLERFRAAGFDPDTVDTVVHTHLHADHVGWDTHLVDGAWRPTFPSARHLYVGAELEHWRHEDQRRDEDVYADSVEPIFAAGLADIVDADTDLGDGLRLVSTPGHTPGHASLEIAPAGDGAAVVSGDLLHHPVQLAHPEWREVADVDPDVARTTRTEFLARHANTGALVLGTHFPTAPAGFIHSRDDRWRFRPEPGAPIAS